MAIDRLEIKVDKSGEPSTEARQRSLAFFLPGFVDLINIDSYRREAISFAGLLNSSDSPDSLNAGFNQGLIEALEQFDQIINASDGTLFIKVPKNLHSFSTHYQAVIQEYGEEAEGLHPDFELLMIPTDKITACRSLPFPSSPDNEDLHPVVDMRIQTSTDTNATVYSAPGIVANAPNPGRWVSFPLEHAEFAFLADN